MFGLALVLLSSRAMILSVTELAEVHWHVPKVVIASTLVALGTSLPELVIGMASIMKGHKEILVGNIVGADVLNVLFVIGASATAAPLPIIEDAARIPRIALYVHLPAMLLILVMFRLFVQRANSTGNFRRWYGVPLLLVYVGLHGPAIRHRVVGTVPPGGRFPGRTASNSAVVSRSVFVDSTCSSSDSRSYQVGLRRPGPKSCSA